MLFQLLHQMRGKKADRSYNLAVSIRKHFEGDFQQFDVTEIDLENRLASFRIDDVTFNDIPLDITSDEVSFEIDVQPSA